MTGTRPHTDLQVAWGAYNQFVATGDDYYLDNLNGDELRALAKHLGTVQRANDPLVCGQRTGGAARPP